MRQASNFEKKVSAEKLSAKAKATAQLQHRLTAAQVLSLLALLAAQVLSLLALLHSYSSR